MNTYQDRLYAAYAMAHADLLVAQAAVTIATHFPNTSEENFVEACRLQWRFNKEEIQKSVIKLAIQDAEHEMEKAAEPPKEEPSNE